MDQSFLLMLSNLLHLQNQLDPTTSLLNPPSSSSSPTSSSSAAPLLFFTLTSILSYVSSLSNHPSTKSPRSKKSKLDNNENSNDDSNAYSVAAFRAMSTERIWHMDPPLRDSQWRSQYGLSYPVFTTVVDKLKPHIAASNLSLPSDYAVAMVLSRLAHGLSSHTIASRYNLTPYLVSKITNMVTRLLSTKLYPEFIKIPVGKRRIVETTLGFEELTGLSNMCGAIDGSHVKIRRRKNEGLGANGYQCRYGFDSVLLQVVSDHKNIFWDVCVKAPGGCDDAMHFRESLLYERLMSGDVDWDNVRGTGSGSSGSSHLRPYVVGDWCYPLLSFLMTPFFSNGRSGDEAKDLFDSALMKGRNVVVEAIGLLKGRWRILQDLNVGINHAPQTIVACCVLHNLCQIAREPEPEIWKEPEETGHQPRVLESEKSSYYLGESMRQVMADDLFQRYTSR